MYSLFPIYFQKYYSLEIVFKNVEENTSNLEQLRHHNLNSYAYIRLAINWIEVLMICKMQLKKEKLSKISYF